MSREFLYEIAFEMLNVTNVFDSDLSEIKYTIRESGEAVEISLLTLVKEEAQKDGRYKYRGKSKENLQRTYDCIADALVLFLENYSTAYSYKQRVKAQFKEWLETIGSKFDIDNNFIPESLVPGEADLGIRILKLLHSRNGVTYDDFIRELGLKSERSAQKYLVKLSPSLYTGTANEPPYPPFYLGGHPLYAEIENIGDKYEAKKKRFISRNTIHPLVLQQNIMQLATMLKSLCHQYEDYGDEMARYIAVDIWYQLSDYAQSKIKNYYAYNDPDLEYFIRAIDGKCPDDHAVYRKEKEYLLEDIERPIDTALADLEKVRGRTGTIILNNGKRIEVRYLEKTRTEFGEKAYQATDINGDSVVFTLEQVDSIHFS